jgi:hypothetical protein
VALAVVGLSLAGLMVLLLVVLGVVVIPIVAIVDVVLSIVVLRPVDVVVMVVVKPSVVVLLVVEGGAGKQRRRRGERLDSQGNRGEICCGAAGLCGARLPAQLSYCSAASNTGEQPAARMPFCSVPIGRVITAPQYVFPGCSKGHNQGLLGLGAGPVTAAGPVTRPLPRSPRPAHQPPSPPRPAHPAQPTSPPAHQPNAAAHSPRSLARACGGAPPCG